MQHRRLALPLLLSGLLLGGCMSINTSQPASSAAVADPSAVVQKQLDAYNKHDLNAFLATYSDRVLLYRIPGTTPVISGKQQLGEFYRTSRFNLPNLHAELLHRTVVGSKVVDHERISGLRPQPVEAVAAYVVNEGLIESVWLFYPE